MRSSSCWGRETSSSSLLRALMRALLASTSTCTEWRTERSLSAGAFPRKFRPRNNGKTRTACCSSFSILDGMRLARLLPRCVHFTQNNCCKRKTGISSAPLASQLCSRPKWPRFTYCSTCTEMHSTGKQGLFYSQSQHVQFAKCWSCESIERPIGANHE